MRRTIIVLALISFAHSLLGQVETTQYFMTTLPQVVDSNPAFVPKFSYAVGLPLSRVGTMYTNSGFTFNDAITKEQGKNVFDVHKWQQALPEKTYITSSSQVDLFRLGAKIGDNLYMSLHSTARVVSQAMFPRDIAVLLDGGNAAYVGQTAGLAPTFHGMSFWETGLGFSYAATEKLRIGAKVKKLYGAHSVNTKVSELLLSVDEDYAMTLSADLHVQTSGVQDPDFAFKEYLKNSGWGGDIGATYQLLPKLNLAASVVDLGYIKWRHNLYDYKMSKATANFSFSGLDVQDVLDGNTASFDQQLDSLGENFKLNEGPGTEYKMMLPAKMYLSGSFDITKSLTLGGLFFTEQFNGRTGAGWTTSLNKNFGRWLTTSLSYTVSNRSYNNFGVGVAMRAGPLQIYAVGDNVLGMPVSVIKTGVINSHVNNAQVYNARLGINFVWGWKKVSPLQEDNSKSYNEGKKDNRKQMEVDNSKAFNSGKSGPKATSNTKKQPKAKKGKPSSKVKARQKMIP